MSEFAELRLYDTDLVTVLGIIPYHKADLYLLINEPGSGSLETALENASAALVTSGGFVEVRYRDGMRGGFFVENIGSSDASGQENTGRLLTVSGRGALALLDDAIVWDDGTGSTKRGFSGTQAGMLITLIDEAQVRGALLNLSYDFTSLADSDGTPWTDNLPLELTVGTSLLDVVRQIAKTGIDFNILPDGSGAFVLSAYLNEIGSNKSDTVFMRLGVNCEEVGREEAGGDIRNTLRIKYRDGFVTAKDDASITARRRREKSLNLDNAQTADAALTYGGAELEQKKDPRKQISLKVYDGKGPRAFVDYAIGDTISLDKNGTVESYRVRGIHPSWSGDGLAEVIIDLNSMVLENEIRLTQDLDWLMNEWKTAHDAGLMQVSFWAAIGDPNITYSIVDMVIAGTNLYALNSDGGLLKYDIDAGGWARIATIPTTDMKCLGVVGSDVYIAAGSRLYKYSGTTLSLYATFYYLDVPSLTFIASMEVVGTYIYIHGNFDDAYITTDVAITGVARINTLANTVSDVGGDFGLYDTMTTDGTNLYMMSSNAKQAMRWSGSAWTDLGSPFANAIYTLAVYGDQLLAGGVDGIFVWDGATWAEFGGNVSGAVHDIAVYLTDVYVAGDFTDPASHVVKYAGGQWVDLAGGVDASATRLAFHDQDLYVAGSFTHAGDKTAQGVAAYFNNFEALANYLENSESTFNMAEAIHNAAEKHPLVGADEFGFWDSVSQQLRKISWTNILASIKTYTDTLYVALTGAQTVAGVKTFSSFPVTPSSAPTTNYQVANKKYVDDSVGGVSATPGGSDTQIQYNNAGAFGGSADLVRNSDGSISIGGTPPIGTTAYGVFQKADAVSVTNVLASFGASVASFITGIRARGTYASQLAVLLDDVIFRIRGRAHDGSTIGNTSAEVRMVANENHSSTAHGTRLEIHATPDGSTTLTKILSILGSGHVNIEAGKQYRVNGAQHQHVLADITDYTPPTTGGAIQRVLTSSLTLADGECLVLTDYINPNTHDIILEGDANLRIL